MPIKMSWYDAGQRVYLLEQTGKVEMAEIEDTMLQLLPILNEGPLYLISDTRNAKLPVNLITKKQVSDVFRHPNMKFVAAIQDNMFIQYAGQLLGHGKIGVYSSLEKAIEAIQGKLG